MRLVHSSKGQKNMQLNTIVVVIVVVSAILIGGIAGTVLAVDKDTFSRGVSIGGVDVSGISLEQAKQMILSNAQKQVTSIHLPVVFNNNKVELNADDLGISSNATKVLEEAFAFNKNSGDSLPERFDKSVQQAQTLSYKVGLVVDQNKLVNTLTQLEDKYGIKPVDAQAIFDKKTKTFRYVQSQYGKEINMPDIVSTITDHVNKGDFSELDIPSQAVAPKLSADDLKANTSLIGICETKTTDESDRNTNIRLVCEALDGQVINPGQILSINGLIGERTGEKGYKMAPAIIDGTLADQFGGGICQVAGTLYNAALLADMTIVERVHHTWPSSYLPVGLDATLNWDDKDLKIQNTTDMPIYVSAKFQNQAVRVELYGKPLQDNMTVTLDNVIEEKDDPPASDVIYTNALAPGAQQTQTSPREGYIVDVYRVFSQNGNVVNKELISRDTYLAIKGVILVGTAAQQK